MNKFTLTNLLVILISILFFTGCDEIGQTEGPETCYGGRCAEADEGVSSDSSSCDSCDSSVDCGRGDTCENRIGQDCNDEDVICTWEFLIGAYSDQQANHVVEMGDNDFIIVGNHYDEYALNTDTEERDYSDALILKVTKDGHRYDWTRVGGSGNEEIFDIIKTSDDEYMLVGYTTSTNIEVNPSGHQIWNMFETDRQIFVIKLSSSGCVRYTKKYGGAGYDVGWKILETSDGDFLIFGRTGTADLISEQKEGDISVLKINKDGDLLDSNTYGGNGDEHFYAVTKTAEDKFLIVGSSNSTDIEGYLGNKDVYLVRLDANGDFVDENLIGGSDYDLAGTIYKTTSDELILLGASMSPDIEGFTNGESEDAYFIRLDNYGNFISQGLYGGNNYDDFEAAVETGNGNIILVGKSNSDDIEGNKEERDILVVRLDSDFNFIDQRLFGSDLSDSASFAFEIENGGFIIVGDQYCESANNNGVYVLKFSEYSELVSEQIFDGNGNDKIMTGIVMSDAGILLVGQSNSTDLDGGYYLYTNDDVYMIKLNENGEL